MSVSRRDFLLGLSASAAVVSLPFPCRAEASLLYPPIDLSYFASPIHRGDTDIRIGYSASAWQGHDRQAIQDISTLGYGGIQLRADAVEKFPNPHALHDTLAEHRLRLVALSSGDAAIDSALRRSMIETHVQNARYLREADGLYLQLTGTPSNGRTFSAADLKDQGQLLTEIAKRAADFGVQTGFRNDRNTIGQTPQDLDAILDAADPNYVKLGLDIAQYAQGGGDPSAAIRKYGKRILFLHLKDVKDSATPAGYQFTELGQGRLDLSAAMASLHDIHFRGWGIIELDGERPGVNRTLKESAELSKNYLEQKLSVRI